ncbi:hypothetical protein TEA_023775 [Camellia sinensis var. sinensis]|uniref:Uncharacterized protein n=1 Tax=Camellia sinensis var. sinensis TaxID=542762 RepID=A0A4S4ENZ0_CAMSN|nr:hypothetical protein TEA_023775 [Camellia sinensis var. sinensis]
MYAEVPCKVLVPGTSTACLSKHPCYRVLASVCFNIDHFVDYRFSSRWPLWSRIETEAPAIVKEGKVLGDGRAELKGAVEEVAVIVGRGRQHWSGKKQGLYCGLEMEIWGWLEVLEEEGFQVMVMGMHRIMVFRDWE